MRVSVLRTGITFGPWVESVESPAMVPGAYCLLLCELRQKRTTSATKGHKLQKKRWRHSPCAMKMKCYPIFAKRPKKIGTKVTGIRRRIGSLLFHLRQRTGAILDINDVSDTSLAPRHLIVAVSHALRQTHSGWEARAIRKFGTSRPTFSSIPGKSAYL
jgi:hypothetical protein